MKVPLFSFKMERNRPSRITPVTAKTSKKAIAAALLPCGFTALALSSPAEASIPVSCILSSQPPARGLNPDKLPILATAASVAAISLKNIRPFAHCKGSMIQAAGLQSPPIQGQPEGGLQVRESDRDSRRKAHPVFAAAQQLRNRAVSGYKKLAAAGLLCKVKPIREAGGFDRLHRDSSIRAGHGVVVQFGFPQG
jgi:hypothetical protein